MCLSPKLPDHLQSIEVMPPISTKIIGEFLKDHDFIGISQRIRKLKITPQPNSILFEFGTNQPTVPVIEIFRLARTANGTIVFLPQDLITVKFDFVSALVGNYFTEHKGRIDGLTQDTDYSFRITAGNGALKAAVTIGSFRTGKRSAAFVIRDIQLFNDGDPGLKGSGEMAFGYGFYNDNGDRISPSDDPYYHNNNISSGALINLPFGTVPTFITNNAPDWMSAYVGGYENDNFFIPFHWWVKTPTKLPENPTHFENDDGVGADAFQYLQLPDSPGSHRVGFSLDSGPWGIHYITTGWADVQVTLPTTVPNIPKSATVKQANWPPGIRATLRSVGQQVGIEHPGGLRSVMALGPNGLLALRLQAGKHRRNHNWKMIEASGVDSAALVAIQEGILLFTLSGDKVRQRVVSVGENRSDTEWHELGQGFRPPLSAVTLLNGAMVLTVLGQDGNLYGMLMQPDQGEGRWINLGGDFAGSVVVLPKRRSVAIFGLTPGGKVLTAEWYSEAQEDVSWQTLEGEPFGFLYAGEENGTTHIIGLTPDRQVFALSCEEGQWAARWTPLGTLDDVDMEDTDTTAEMV